MKTQQAMPHTNATAVKFVEGRRLKGRKQPPQTVVPGSYGVIVGGKLRFVSKVRSACQKFVDRFGSGEIVARVASDTAGDARPAGTREGYHVGSVSESGRILWMYGEDMTLEEAEVVASNSRLKILAPGVTAPKVLQLPPRAVKRLGEFRKHSVGTQPIIAELHFVVVGDRVHMATDRWAKANVYVETYNSHRPKSLTPARVVTEVVTVGTPCHTKELACTHPSESPCAGPMRKPKQYQVLDTDGKVIHTTDTKHGAAAFRVARGYGTVVRVRCDGTTKPVTLPPLPSEAEQPGQRFAVIHDREILFESASEGDAWAFQKASKAGQLVSISPVQCE